MHGDRAPWLQRFFRLARNDDVTNQIAQIRFGVRCGERLAAEKYCFDDLLSQMTASVQNAAAWPLSLLFAGLIGPLELPL